MRTNRRFLNLTIGLLIGFFSITLDVWAAGAGITGKVVYEGEAVAQKPINFGAEKQCALMHGDQMPLSEEIIVNPNGTLKSVLVYIKEEITNAQVPTTPVVIDQKGCVFSPHVSVAMVGQPVDFVNSDDLLHNVRTVSKANKLFNIAQPVQGMKTTKKFDQSEIGIQLRCDVHFWMVSYIHVLSHPYFAVTGEDGNFSIQGLPAGTYTLEMWHEKLGTQSQTVTVVDGDQKTIDFTLKQT